MGKKRTFVITSGVLSANGYIIDPQGIDISRFEANPIMLWEHGRDARFRDAIGRWENIKFSEGKWYADAVLQETTDNADLAELKNKVEEGLIKACSIGIWASEITKGKNNEPDRITKSELFEVSLVNIPANREATIVQMSIRESCSFLETETIKPKYMSKLSEFVKGLVGLEESTDPQAVPKLQEQMKVLEADFAVQKTLIESLQAEKSLLEKANADLIGAKGEAEKKLVEKTAEFEAYAKANPVTHTRPNPVAMTAEEKEKQSYREALLQANPNLENDLSKYKETYGGGY